MNEPPKSNPERTNDLLATAVPPEATAPYVPETIIHGEGLTAESQTAPLPNIPGYDILGILGRGGMGVVYRAHQRNLNRLVALKMILGGGKFDAEDVARFRAEATHARLLLVWRIARGIRWLYRCWKGSSTFRVGSSVGLAARATDIHPRPIRADADWVYQARFSRDGKSILTASRDRTARIWDVESGLPVGSPMEHRAEVYSAAFSHDGRWVFTATNDGTVGAWDRRTCKPVTPRIRIGDTPANLNVALNGKIVVVTCDRSLRFWGWKAWAEPGPADDPDALCRWAELLSVKKLIPNGGTAHLTPVEWQDLWNQRRLLRGTLPELPEKQLRGKNEKH